MYADPRDEKKSEDPSPPGPPSRLGPALEPSGGVSVRRAVHDRNDDGQPRLCGPGAATCQKTPCLYALSL